MNLLDKLYYHSLKPELPRTIMIEPTNACNLKCHMCDYQKQLSGKRAHLSLKDFESIVGQFPKINGLILCGLGEPLLNGDTVGMVSIAAKKRVPFINLITNGILLEEGRLESLINAGLTRIQISFHSTDPAIAGKINGASEEIHSLVRGNIINAVKVKKRLGSDLCIVVNSVMNADNYKDLFNLIDFCESCGVNEINFVQLTTIFGKYDNFNIARDKAGPLIKEIRRRLKKSSLKANFLSGTGQGRCYQFWDFIMVHADGNISPCNGIMPQEKINVGNLINDRISNIWHSDEYVGLRKSLIGKRLKNCRYCEVGYLLEGKNLRWFNNYYLKPLAMNLYSYMRHG